LVVDGYAEVLAADVDVVFESGAGVVLAVGGSARTHTVAGADVDAEGACGLFVAAGHRGGIFGTLTPCKCENESESADFMQ